MPSRSLSLLGVAVAAILVALGAANLAALQAAFVPSFGLLGMFAIGLFRGIGRSSRQDPRVARVSERLRELRRLAAATRNEPVDTIDFEEQTVDVYPWPDEEEEQEEQEEDLVRVEEQSVARRLTERLAPPAPEAILDGRRSSRRDSFAELLREGEDLRTLARLLKIDLTAYGDQLNKGLAAARVGRFEQCGLYLQVANERLRFQVHSALAEALLASRSPPYNQR
jgi:hypothetical protein